MLILVFGHGRDGCFACMVLVLQRFVELALSAGLCGSHFQVCNLLEGGNVMKNEEASGQRWLSWRGCEVDKSEQQVRRCSFLLSLIYSSHRNHSLDDEMAS